ncbi:uncharacterized protein LOC105190977 [Harpegnathos saltator]|uniref:uncharacterized protein LOC105190977 n=1 Tax=Harpegnathos saltator TaxID=610380 RepID=UPI00058C8210|nr:uncharacterized protein LOC105190977 [Harpegnathos saltator]
MFKRNSCIKEIASWKDDNATKMLISLWKEHETKFKSSKFRNDTIWNDISAKMWDANSNWHYIVLYNVKTSGKIYVKHTLKLKIIINTSGNNPKTCKFYDEIDDILNDKPNITPILITSNLRKRPLLINSASNCMDSENSSSYANFSYDDPDYIRNKKSNKRKIPHIEREFKEWCTASRADAKGREARERRHKEILNQ